MTDFRTQAPPSGKITRLDYSAPEKEAIGQTSLYCTAPKENEVIKLHLYWPFGTQFQKQRFQARSALSLSLNGTSQRSAEEIQDQFDFWGTSVSTDTGLFSSELTLKTTKEFYLESLRWLLENHSGAVFPEHELDNYKQIELANLQRKTATPRYWANRLGMESLFGINNPNTRFTDPEHIQAVERPTLQDFHAGYLHPGMATWILSGDRDPALLSATREIITSLANFAPAGQMPILEFENAVSGETHFRKKIENTSQVSMFLARKLPAIDENEYHLFSLLNLVLGGFFGSRLMQEIREERGLTYGIGSYISQTTEGNVWCVSGEMNSVNTEQALDATKELMQSFIDNPPTGDELERAKRYYSGQLRTSFDGPFSMANKIKGLLTRGYTFAHYDTALDAIWNASTDDLCQLANNYLRPESFHSVLAGDISS